MRGASLLRTRSIDQSIEDTKDADNGLRRVLGPLDLVVYGVGVIIGTGIFVLTGKAAGTLAGPAIAQIISVGALAGLTTVTLILMMGQSRVFFAMSRDHLLPSVFSRVSKRFKTPYRTTIVTGVAVAILAFLVDLETLAELVNIGTLFAFIVVALGVIVLRRTRPDLERAYRTPWVPLVPILAVLASLWLMLNLPAQTWERFGIWMVLGLVLFFAYGRRRSRLN